MLSPPTRPTAVVGYSEDTYCMQGWQFHYANPVERGTLTTVRDIVEQSIFRGNLNGKIRVVGKLCKSWWFVLPYQQPLSHHFQEKNCCFTVKLYVKDVRDVVSSFFLKRQCCRHFLFEK